MCEDKHEKEGSTGEEQSGSAPQDGSNRADNPSIACQSTLSDLLQIRKEERALSLKDLAALIGIKQPYMSQLMRGERQFSALSGESLRAIAVFLGVPAVRVFLMANVIRQEDLYSSREEEDHLLESEIRKIAGSPYAQEASVGLTELLALPKPVKYLLMFLYQSAIQSTLGPAGASRWKSFARSSTFRLRTNRSK